jgi:hypothetical protein
MSPRLTAGVPESLVQMTFVLKAKRGGFLRLVIRHSDADGMLVPLMTLDERQCTMLLSRLVQLQKLTD